MTDTQTHKPGKVIHGMCKTREYKSWKRMKERCLNPNHKSYPRYGGRGITVCERWKNSFLNFYSDMGPKPQNHTINRLDNKGNYCPENCRWASVEEQNNNKENSHLLTYNGETLTLSQWAKRFNINSGTLCNRLKRNWDVEKSLTTPVANNEKLITFKGKTLNISQWAKKIGIKPKTLSRRLKRGMPLSKALQNNIQGR